MQSQGHDSPPFGSALNIQSGKVIFPIYISLLHLALFRFESYFGSLLFSHNIMHNDDVSSVEWNEFGGKFSAPHMDSHVEITARVEHELFPILCRCVYQTTSLYREFM